MGSLAQNGITRLATKQGVDLNSTTEQIIYSIPPDKFCIVAFLIIHSASISLTTATVSAGYNVTFDDLIADTGLTELTDPTLFTIKNAKPGAKIKNDKLFIKPNTAQGAAATVTIEVFGYLINQ